MSGWPLYSRYRRWSIRSLIPNNITSVLTKHVLSLIVSKCIRLVPYVRTIIERWSYALRNSIMKKYESESVTTPRSRTLLSTKLRVGHINRIMNDLRVRNFDSDFGLAKNMYFVKKPTLVASPIQTYSWMIESQGTIACHQRTDRQWAPAQERVWNIFLSSFVLLNEPCSMGVTSSMEWISNYTN